jgi:hypothetical protein
VKYLGIQGYRHPRAEGDPRVWTILVRVGKRMPLTFDYKEVPEPRGDMVSGKTTQNVVPPGWLGHVPPDPCSSPTVPPPKPHDARQSVESPMVSVLRERDSLRVRAETSERLLLNVAIAAQQYLLNADGKNACRLEDALSDVTFPEKAQA